MEYYELNKRTLELVISKVFDELTPEESYELSNILKYDERKDFIEGLIQDREKLMDYMSEYSKKNSECDDTQLEKAKQEFEDIIAKMKMK